MDINFLRLGLWAAVAGGGIPVMAVLNARMGRALGEPVHAAWALFAVGLTILTVVSLFATGTLPELDKLRSIRLVDLGGGAIVGFYVLSVTLLAPRFGIGNTILFAVSAQILTSAAIDHFGLFGAAVRSVSGLRAGGIGLLLCGLIVSQVAARAHN